MNNNASSSNSTKPSYQDVHGKMNNGPVIDKDGLAVQSTGVVDIPTKPTVVLPPGNELEKTTKDIVPPIPPVQENEKKTLEEQFFEIVDWVKTSSMSPTNEEKLLCYSYYKQATEGDVTGSQPWAIQVTARAKWDAWNKVKGMDKKEAMQKYIEEVNIQRKKYGC